MNKILSITRETIINDFLSHGKQLTVLEKLGKKPLHMGWTHLNLQKETLLKHKGNIGWVLGKCDLVVDVDMRNHGEKSWETLHRRIKEYHPQLNLTPTVSTPGGYHYYFKIPEKYRIFKLRKKIPQYEGIDFLSIGTQCVIPSSLTIKGSYAWKTHEESYFHQHMCCQYILDLLLVDKAFKEVSSDTNKLDEFSEILSPKLNKRQILDKLSYLDPSNNNDFWVKVGMALKAWDPIKGLDLWEKWSQEGTNYKEGETVKRWKSFKNNVKNGITEKTLNYLAIQSEYEKEEKYLAELLLRIGIASKQTLETHIIPEISKKNFQGTIVKRQIVQSLKQRYYKLAEVRLPNHVLEEKLDWNNKQSLNGKLFQEIPQWCKEWVYITEKRQFFNIQTFAYCDKEGFDISNAGNPPVTKGGIQQTASAFIKKYPYITVVKKDMYMPHIDQRIFMYSGNQVLNIYNAASCPKKALRITSKGTKAYHTFLTHIKLFFPEHKKAKFFIDWIAHLVQKPGCTLKWSPFIQCIENLGIDYFWRLLKGCLGDENVRIISPYEVNSKFNDWACGSILNVIKEIVGSGYDTDTTVSNMNSLITDNEIRINEKGLRARNVPNVTNYICFTTNKSALPMSNTDRCYWVHFAPVQKIEDLPNIVGMSIEDYYKNLYDSIKHYKQIKRYLWKHNISEEFKQLRGAPVTKAKESLIKTRQTETLGLNECIEIIASGSPGVACEVIAADYLKFALRNDYNITLYNTNGVTNILRKLGYSVYNKQLYIKGELMAVWVKNLRLNEWFLQVILSCTFPEEKTIKFNRRFQ